MEQQPLPQHKPLLSRFFGGIAAGVHHFYIAYDMEAWPAFLMFLVVVTLGMGMNFLVMRNIVGDFLAIMVSVLFEAGILAWKVQSWRRKNNDAQDEITSAATWGSVGLAVLMLVVNLFRVRGDNTGLMWTGNTIIGAAALIHVVAYLSFDQKDTDRAFNRTAARDSARVRQAQQSSAHTIDTLKADMAVIRLISTELHRISLENQDLPPEMREPVLEAARRKLLEQYHASDNVDRETAPMSDLNGDGVIGTAEWSPQAEPALPAPQYQAALIPAPVSPHRVPPEPTHPKSYTLKDALVATGKSLDEVRSLLQQSGMDGDVERAFYWMNDHGLLPPDITYDNFVGLYQEITNPTLRRPG